MTHHSELLNYLITKHELKSYLEIGTYNRSHNFELINIAEKTCVDPDPAAQADYQCTSDYFFENLNQLAADEGGGQTFDLIFIDGLHHADQVKKDFDNALKILKPCGYIVLHDCNPHSEHITHVPRDNGEWCGDVYKFASRLQQYDGIDFRTVQFDYGCAVIWRKKKTKGTPLFQDVTWDYFSAHREELLRLVTVEEFLKM